MQNIRINNKMDIKQALEELRKLEKRKFDQTVDLIINLKGVDMKRENISTIVNIPHSAGTKKVCAFLTKKSDVVDTITSPDFQRYKEKKALKNLVKNYDFFIAIAPLMPSVATTFGKVLGPAGKMPSPQLGILTSEDPKAIKEMLDKIGASLKIRVKEASVKMALGKESMKDEDLIANANAIYSGLVSVLPIKKENIRSVMVKLTMSKPLKVEIK